MKPDYSNSANKARDYYNGSDAHNFYSAIWGGADIHIGIYEQPNYTIARASLRTVERMASLCSRLGPASRIADLGSGYGGAARHLVTKFNCHVDCLDVSETHNCRNVELTAEAGLGDRIRVTAGSFEQLPFADHAFDVVWSQDALLHSGHREKVVSEASRVLHLGGEFVFTDVMQTEKCPDHALSAILDRIDLESLGMLSFYREVAKQHGLKDAGFNDLSPNVAEHYERVRRELNNRYDELVDGSGREYVDRMLQGLANWVEAGERGYLCWGILRFQKG